MSAVHTILALARPARLPSAWSNCLAGWWLGGAAHADHLPLVFGAVTLLCLGGAFLNDAFDADFDRERYPGRPIPAGKVSQTTVWRLGLAFLTAGALLLLWPGRQTGTLGLILVSLIVFDNATHRFLPFSPVLKGLCRLALYLLGASIAVRGITGWAIWCGLALAVFVTGTGYLARPKNDKKRIPCWPVFLLATPIVLAVLMDAGEYRESGLLLSAVVALWVVRCLRPTFWTTEPDPLRTRAGLSAAIVFVDWLAVCPANLPGRIGSGPRELSFVFLALFALTLLLQKLTPER